MCMGVWVRFGSFQGQGPPQWYSKHPEAIAPFVFMCFGMLHRLVPVTLPPTHHEHQWLSVSGFLVAVFEQETIEKTRQNHRMLPRLWDRAADAHDARSFLGCSAPPQTIEVSFPKKQKRGSMTGAAVRSKNSWVPQKKDPGAIA